MKVVMIAATSLDGRIGQRGDQSPLAWTSKEDQRWFQTVSQKIGVVIIGRKTFAILKSPLNNRRLVVITSDPSKYQPKARPGLVEFTDLSPENLVRNLTMEGLGAVLVAGGSQVYTQFLQKGLVTELWLTIEPQLFGTGPPLARGKMPNLSFKLLSLERLNQSSLLLKYQVLKAQT